jgi:hypothetical protein
MKSSLCAADLEGMCPDLLKRIIPDGQSKRKKNVSLGTILSVLLFLHKLRKNTKQKERKANKRKKERKYRKNKQIKICLTILRVCYVQEKTVIPYKS